MKIFKPHYSGNKSRGFWEKINSHRGIKQNLLYTLGCCLQNLEEMVLKEVNDEHAKSYKKETNNAKP